MRCGQIAVSWQRSLQAANPLGKGAGQGGWLGVASEAAWETAGVAGHVGAVLGQALHWPCPRADTVLSHLDHTDPLSLRKPRFKGKRVSPRLMRRQSVNEGHGAWRLDQMGFAVSETG